MFVPQTDQGMCRMKSAASSLISPFGFSATPRLSFRNRLGCVKVLALLGICVSLSACMTGGSTSIGGSSGPMANLAPRSLSFPGVMVGTTSPVQTVTVSNPGTDTLMITGITATANYAQTNTCGTSLGVGMKCTISVTFTPPSDANSPGTISIADN